MKSFKLLDQQTPSKQRTPINWNLCFLCQKDTQETLSCPADYVDRFKGAGYQSLARNLLAFTELGCIPAHLDIRTICQDGNLEQTLMQKKARLHKSCSLQFNSTELKRASKRKYPFEKSDITSEIYMRHKASNYDSEITTCFFCNKEGHEDPLHKVRNTDVDIHVRQCASDLQDQPLIAKLSVGDLVAQNAYYHRKCLVALYNKHRRISFHDKENQNDTASAAFDEVIQYICHALESEGTSPVFKLSQVKHLYNNKMQALADGKGQDVSPVHSTRLKNDILNFFPELVASNIGREILLVQRKDIGSSLKKSCETGGEDLLLNQTADIIRKDILGRKSALFDGHFQPQESSVPDSLLRLVNLIMYGKDRDASDRSKCSQAALSVAQLLTFNTHSTAPKLSTCRHSTDRETPLPLFLGTMIHSKTRSKDIINIMHDLGLSVSYDRVLGLSTDLCNSALAHFNEIGTVCPPSLKMQVFTTAAVDNIDHDPSATTAQTSFHGTGISLFQHPRSQEDGESQVKMQFETGTKKIGSLPDNYTHLPAVVTPKKHLHAPAISGLQKPSHTMVEGAIVSELEWCKHVAHIALDGNMENSNGGENNEMKVSWAAYHSSHKPSLESVPCNTAMLPLFTEDSKSSAMMKHAMHIVKNAIAYLNPGQVPVMACDQPLFKLVKDIQWTWPDELGETSMVVMLGGLHIKMALLKSLGNLLEGSGWTEALSQAHVASTGTADSFLKAHHVKKTLRAHQVTACALNCLEHEAYENYVKSAEQHPVMPFKIWSRQMVQDHPQFYFWHLVLQTQLEIFGWDRAVHEGNFALYVEMLASLQWLFHALDHFHYARSVAIHLRDMLALKDLHPEVYSEFRNGNFTCQKTERPFSRMPLDESHEQNNAHIKACGGAIGLTESPTALLRWMVGGPEVSRAVGEFTDSLKKKPNTHSHHEDTPAVQAGFLKHVAALRATMTEMGSPFADASTDLVALHTQQVMGTDAVESLRKLEGLGRQQDRQFFEERLMRCDVPLNDPIKKNKISIFGQQSNAMKSRKDEQLDYVKKDRNLFSTLFITSKTRDMDQAEFFRHENHEYPPALSQYGRLRSGTKSDIMTCLENMSDVTCDPNPEMMVIDGAALVHMIKPNDTDTFHQYSEKLAHHVEHLFSGSIRRIDVIFDEYSHDSLKAATWKKRGQGTRIRVQESKRVPGNWQDFLKCSENKMELFSLISKTLVSRIYPGTVVATLGENVLHSEECSVENLSPCTHSEADTRLLLHALDGSKQGFDQILIKTVDSDVLVLAVSLAPQIRAELWLAFGTGKTFRYINATDISRNLGERNCKALMSFHALTGSDTTSSFNGKGKRKAWGTWKLFEDLTAALLILGEQPSVKQVEEVLPTIERFVVLLYDKSCTEASVNRAREIMFYHKGKDTEHIPPTQDALLLHILRVAYQAGHVWQQSLLKSSDPPKPDEYGWIWIEETREWQVKWMTLPPASKACRAILKCNCVKGCTGRCTCRKANIKCTSLCKCRGCNIVQ